MNTKLYIGSELADFNEIFNVMYSIGDIRNTQFGNNNKTYTLNLPQTKNNIRILKYITRVDVKTETSSIGRLYQNDYLIIKGKVVVNEYTEKSISVIITSDEWIDSLKDSKLTTLDFSVYNHNLTHVNIQDSWSAIDPFYRYPMINFGALLCGEIGATAKWHPGDFIPMFSVAKLIEAIFSPFTLSSTWLSSSFVKSLFIIAKETIAPADFITKKNLNVTVETMADNTASDTDTETIHVTLSKNIEFGTVVTDEAIAWSVETYTIPATGTYRFKATIVTKNTGYANSDITITNEILQLFIKQNTSTIAEFISATYTGTELIEAIVNVLDSFYVHCVTGDTITVAISCLCEATVLSGTQTVTLSVHESSGFINIWGPANQYAGLNKPMNAALMLPDMTRLDFLSAIRDMFNLKVWMDKLRQVVYIEPWDALISSTVVDLSDYIDYEEITTQLISPNYFKQIRFLWTSDDKDWAVKDYLSVYTDLLGVKDITLNSLYVQNGQEIRQHPFSNIMTGSSTVIGNNNVQIPRILADDATDPLLYTIFNRLTGFKTRIVEWKGLTAGVSFKYEDDILTDYPKVQSIDWDYLYSNYWIKFFHYIDKGKLFTIRMKVKPGMLTEFFTIVNTAVNEGFRPTYKIAINGIDQYFFLQKITSDGIKAELELVLK